MSLIEVPGGELRLMFPEHAEDGAVLGQVPWRLEAAQLLPLALEAMTVHVLEGKLRPGQSVRARLDLQLFQDTGPHVDFFTVSLRLDSGDELRSAPFTVHTFSDALQFLRICRRSKVSLEKIQDSSCIHLFASTSAAADSAPGSAELLVSQDLRPLDDAPRTESMSFLRATAADARLNSRLTFSMSAQVMQGLVQLLDAPQDGRQRLVEKGAFLTGRVGVQQRGLRAHADNWIPIAGRSDQLSLEIPAEAWSAVPLGTVVVGFAHTHPFAAGSFLSAQDRFSACHHWAWPHLSNLVISLSDDSRPLINAWAYEGGVLRLMPGIYVQPNGTGEEEHHG
jgi:hypothetical protein